MSNKTFDGYYMNQKSKLLVDLSKFVRKYGATVLISHYDQDLAGTIVKETHHEYEELIPKLPYIGGKKNTLTNNIIQSAWAIALFRALKAHGKTAEETGQILYEMMEMQFQSYPKLLRYLVRRWYFTRYKYNKMKQQAAESQKRLYPEDWVWGLLRGDGKEFDWGIDYTECGTCKFLHAQGADELTPYLCKTDFAMSKALGMGLVRTMTIAEGAEKCDFRFKRGSARFC
jgi:hypothetical protein